MQAHIFVEGLDTTGKHCDLPVKEYYEGLFGMITGLYNELTELVDAQFDVLSEEYAVAGGEEMMLSVYTGDQKPVGSEEYNNKGIVS